MFYQWCLVALFIYSFFGTVALSQESNATCELQVDGRQLTHNGDKVLLKGPAYSPIPIGATFDDANLGDVFIDFFNPIHEKDFALMEEMGVNAIRLYSMWPWDPFKGPNAPRDHKKFLDKALEHGICVWAAFPISNSIFRYKAVASAPTDGSFFVEINGTIYVLDETSTQPGLQNPNETAPQRRKFDANAYKALATKYANHPAISGWIVTNELNLPQNRRNPAFWAFINDLAGELKQIAPKKLTMIATIDDAYEALKFVKNNGIDISNLDIWGVNSYRGRVNPEAQNNFDNLFSAFRDLTSKAPMPLVVSEFGPSSTTRPSIAPFIPVPPGFGDLAQKCGVKDNIIEIPASAQEQVAKYVKGHWDDIVANSDVAAGGFVFEWQDEYYKAGDVAMQVGSIGFADAFPGGCWDEAGFGINAVKLNGRQANEFPFPFPSDERIPRVQFETLKAAWTVPQEQLEPASTLKLVVINPAQRVELATLLEASGDASECLSRAGAGSKLIVGTEDNDRLRGTSRDDVIFSLGGKDTIKGGKGDDCIVGGSGNDVIRGGRGNDSIIGGEGTDKIFGGKGSDICVEGEIVKGC